MKKLIYTLFFINFYLLSFSCECVVDDTLLKCVFNNEQFLSEFRICNSDVHFELYDKTKSFKDTNEYKICNGAILITDRPELDNILPNSYESTLVAKNIIVLHRISKNKKNVTLFFWQPSTGVSVNLTYKCKNGKNKLIKIENGVF